jgi:hypothetical protein
MGLGLNSWGLAAQQPPSPAVSDKQEDTKEQIQQAV